MGRLKIVYPICCGMNVRGDFVIACIATTNVQGVTEYQSRRFSTYTEELRELKAWLDDNNGKDVCMESTGKYWFPIHNILEDTCNVVVSHPKFVKAIKAKRLTRKTHSGLRICLSATLQTEVLFHRKISVSSVTFVVIM